ncbi:uncharacterized protein SPPG_07985 [Spizellomyces punctatus DAOM BR117]|uniref:Thioredoxin-like fold domain-containing protein n=1 Tax=Spizellomyces punctatus (strain DAOM BR117) TaxID=645134 RepID=A0A0L0H6D4_SPIPD|nr:uncharacterized protein SPPG_07985 [Spizellomyces punctatus DAOM BR117]KNC96777.1 hypothetical protein SPPG_07985 [Spizellomyces punctatus DAOM BR117]|eukprot:XP_016604817.1 hypothetical protein SPPG_07985 [Spizellomyces punctatus DAOM BR117]
MASAKYFTGYTLGSPSASTKFEVYLDYLCPFSKKIFSRILQDIHPQYPSISFTFRHQVQPWHPQGTLLHETAIAVHTLAPQKFWDASKLLFDVQTQFDDAKTYELSRKDIYEKLVGIVSDGVGVDKEEVFKLLTPKATNEGNAVTPVLKVHLKIARQNSVHVSPTVLVNGLVDNSVSSSWGVEEWKEYLSKLL